MVKRGMLLILSLVLISATIGCSAVRPEGGINISPEYEPVPPASPLRDVQGVGVTMAFVPQSSLSTIKQGAVYSVDTTAETVRAIINVATNDDFAPTHLTALVNFAPYPAFTVNNGKRVDTIRFDPEPLQQYRFDLVIAVSDLKEGANCLAFALFEDPSIRASVGQRTQQTGLRVDLLVGQKSDNCAGVVTNHEAFEISSGERTVGSMSPATSVAPDKVLTSYTVSRNDLIDQKLYTRVAGNETQEAILVLFLDGRPAVANKKPLVTRLHIPSQSQELRVAAPIPQLDKKASASFMLFPAVESTLENGVLHGQPQAWNQVMILP